MAQTAEGGLKLSAAATGLSVDEYLRRREGGEKWCTRCKTWHPVEKFGRDRSRPDGMAASCLASRKAHYDKTYVSRAKPGPRVITPEGRERMRAGGRKGRVRPLAEVVKGRSPRRGRQPGLSHTPETRAKISRIVRERAARGPAVHSYKDGKVAERRGERFSQAYRRWRFDVFLRDGFACQHCGDARGGNLHAHHLKGFADFPSLRFDLDNGLTLCEECHKALHRGEWSTDG